MADRADERFVNDVRSALDQGGMMSAWPLLFVVCALFAGGLAWAHSAVLEEVTRGDGRIIPSSQMQVVQTLEGGIVSEIMIEEGEPVEAGQALVRIDDTSFASELGELEERDAALEARRVRLEAEVSDADLVFSDDSTSRRFQNQERAVLDARRSTLRQELAVIDQQTAQKELEAVELDTRLTETRRMLDLLNEELTLARRLRQRGNFPQIELLRLERQAQEQIREQKVLEASIPRAAAAIEEAQARREAVIAGFRSRANEELATTLAELSVIRQTLTAASDRVTRTVLKSPVNGIVNALPITTVGAVVQPGQSVAEIVPVEDRLLVEARIRPQDVAFISADQEASVKVTAYDYTVYGALEGRVSRISPDTMTDQEGETFYRVIVETDDAALADGEEELPIIPGMIVQVDILTGQKTVLDYLLTPVNRTRNEALRER
ncbi:MAG: HlyD family type I secretion periplasmic adaptor subunit [Pseudomonadota bacterium]